MLAVGLLLKILGGAWAAQWVKCPALDFGSGHDRPVREFEPCIGLCTDSAEPAWESVTPSLCPSPTLSLKINFKNFKMLKNIHTLKGHLGGSFG